MCRNIIFLLLNHRQKVSDSASIFIFDMVQVPPVTKKEIMPKVVEERPFRLPAFVSPGRVFSSDSVGLSEHFPWDLHVQGNHIHTILISTLTMDAEFYSEMLLSIYTTHIPERHDLY
jgi:hypothetical protein